MNDMKTYTIKIKSREALIQAHAINDDVMHDEDNLARSANKIYSGMYTVTTGLWPGSYQSKDVGLFLKEEIEWIKEELK